MGRRERTSSVCQRPVISASTKFLEPRHVLLGKRNAIERLKKLADAAALEHHGAARRFSGVRGEDRHDEHAAQPVQSLFRADAHAAHLAERAFERAALAAGLPAQAQRDAAALAMVGFGQIDELEVESKGAREQDGALDGQRVHQFQRGGGVARGLFGVAARLGIAAADGALAQRFDLRKKLVAGLLAQHLAQQRAQRAHVAAQRRLFQVAGLRFQLGQPLRPALGIPQKSHRILIMHERIQNSISGFVFRGFALGSPLFGRVCHQSQKNSQIMTIRIGKATKGKNANRGSERTI